MIQDSHSRPRSPLWTISPGSLSPRSRSPSPFSYHERSTSELVRLSCSVVAVEFAYSYTGYVTPLLFERGLSPQVVGLIWAVAPCLGMFLSPILGSISDRWESGLGRRRPFILALGFFLCLGLAILPNASDITSLLFGAHFAYSWPVSIALTVLGVVMVDLCCDSLQSPIRTYMLDVVPLAQQEKANAFFGLFVGIGGSAGFLSLGLDWIKLFPFLQFLETQLRVVCYVAIFIFVIFILITVTSVEEEPYVPLPDLSGATTSEAQGPTLLDRFNTLRHTSYLRSLCLVHFLGYLSYIAYLLYFTDFVASTLFRGEASAEPSSPAYQRYQEGVRTGSVCMAGYAFTATIWSTVIPWLLSRFPVRLIYALPLALFGVSALAAVFFSKLIAMVAVSIAAGIFFASLYTIPFIILAGFEKPSESELDSDEEYDEYEAGLDMFKTSVEAQLAAKRSETDFLTGGAKAESGAPGVGGYGGYGSIDADGERHDEVDGENAGMHVALLSSMQMMAQVFLAAVAGSLIAWGSVGAVMTLSAAAALIGSLACLNLKLPPNLN